LLRRYCGQQKSAEGGQKLRFFQECDETQFWLDYLLRIGLLTESETRQIVSEVVQLLKLFTSIKKKIKDKIESKI